MVPITHVPFIFHTSANVSNEGPPVGPRTVQGRCITNAGMGLRHCLRYTRGMSDLRSERGRPRRIQFFVGLKLELMGSCSDRFPFILVFVHTEAWRRYGALHPLVYDSFICMRYLLIKLKTNVHCSSQTITCRYFPIADVTRFNCCTLSRWEGGLQSYGFLYRGCLTLCTEISFLVIEVDVEYVGM